MAEFQEFNKIARWSRTIVVTEKIDGTNAQVYIRPADGDQLEFGVDTQIDVDGVPHLIRAGSRNQWLGQSKTADNFGFAAWVWHHAHELAALGPGRHFGEWWGAGIQRRYGLEDKRFSLFNCGRWFDQHAGRVDERPGKVMAPACCHVVPMLIEGPNDERAIVATLDLLRERGSYAAPGFMKPEGIVIFHAASRTLYKKTLEGDAMPKSLAA